MALDKEDVKQALRFFKSRLDAEYRNIFALQTDIPAVNESDSALRGRVDVLESEVETLKNFMTDSGVDIDELKTKADSMTDEEITYEDIAELFNQA